LVFVVKLDAVLKATYLSTAGSPTGFSGRWFWNRMIA
jgi:hypothetical protein